MNRQELIRKLQESHQTFIDYINALTENEFTCSHNAKWTAGQQLDHIYLSVKPLAQIVQVPTSIIKLLFGQANRPSVPYDELVHTYLNKLANGGKATGRFTPKTISLEQKQRLVKSLTDKIEKLTSKIGHYSEQDLDQIILPHPLLGKLTLREMICFTIYHVGHHRQTTERNLKSTASS